MGRHCSFSQSKAARRPQGGFQPAVAPVPHFHQGKGSGSGVIPAELPRAPWQLLLLGGTKGHITSWKIISSSLTRSGQLLQDSAGNLQ